MEERDELAAPVPAPPQGTGQSPPPPEGLLASAKAVWANPAYRFVLLFLPYLGLVALGYPLFVEHAHGTVQWFIEMTARVEYWLFAPFSDVIEISGKTVVFGGFAVRIIDECTGIYEMLIFSAAVLAFPTSWRDKMIGLLMGNPLIYLFNVLRIAMLMAVGRFHHASFDFMHLYFWQVTMIVMITSVWLLWILKVVRTDEYAQTDPA